MCGLANILWEAQLASLYITVLYVECKRQEDKFTGLCTLYGVVSIGQAMIFCHVSAYETVLKKMSL